MLTIIFLANSLWNANLIQDNVQCKGMMELIETMVKETGGESCHWRLLGKASKKDDGFIVALVSPEILPTDHSLAGVSCAVNAITFTSGLLGYMTVSGPGEGRIGTACAIFSGIIAIPLRKEGGHGIVTSDIAQTK